MIIGSKIVKALVQDIHVKNAGPYPEMWSGGSNAEGTHMEAPKASTGVGPGKGVSPSPVGVGSGEGLCPLKKIGIFSFEMVHFDAFWSRF